MWGANRRRALQGNAADPKQIRYAERAELRHQKRRLEIYADLLKTPAGRFVLADVIVAAGVGKSPWNPHGSVLSANVGRLEVGLELDEYLAGISLELRRTMWHEWDALIERDNRETDAVQTASAQENRRATDEDS